MSKHDSHWLHRAFEEVAGTVSHAAGTPVAFALACILILLWIFSGPVFRFSDTWQLIINTGTTIVTFLMVFLIQSSQNRDGAAIQAKLDELIRSAANARDAYIGIEDLSEDELGELRALCRRAQERTK